MVVQRRQFDKYGGVSSSGIVSIKMVKSDVAWNPMNTDTINIDNPAIPSTSHKRVDRSRNEIANVVRTNAREEVANILP